MKIGSLVELVDDNWNQELKLLLIVNGMVYPVKNKLYTIRSFNKSGLGVVGIRLEEIVNPDFEFVDGIDELAFSAKRFRELMSPLEISIDEIIHETV